MRIYLGILVALTASCTASAPRTGRCAPVPQELWVGGLPVYRECSVDRAARPTGSNRVQFSPSGQACLRAIVDVVVDAEGRVIPATAQTVRSTDPGFLQALLTSLDGRRYEPAVREGRPVAQLVRIDAAMETRAVVTPLGAPQPSPPRRPSC